MKLRKKWLFIALLAPVSIIGKAQVTYFGKELANSQKLEVFKQTTTLFTLQYKNYAELEKFDQAIKSVWTVSPYKIIKPEELAKYDTTSKYSFFSFDAFADKQDTIINTNIIYSLKLVTPSATPKKKDINVLGYITLFPDIYTSLTTVAQGEKLGATRAQKRKLLDGFYNYSVFFNWSPGLLAGYLKQINDGLLYRQSRALDFQFYNKVRVPELAKETLYVPEYVRQLFSAQKQTGTPSREVQPPYNYKLKFLPTEQLDSLLLKPNSGIKYLVYTQRSNDKIISIYDSKDQQIIYQIFSFQYPYFEMDDLNNIKKVINAIE